MFAASFLSFIKNFKLTMKKLTLIKGRATACLVLLCLFLTQGCKKDLLQPNSNVLKSSLSIAEAKKHFENNVKHSLKSKALMSTGATRPSANEESAADILNSREAIWESAYQKLISTGNAVKIPLDFGKTYAVVDVAKKELIPFGSLNYLFMYKDSLQTIHSEWVILLPDKAWLYGKRDQYTGKIVVKDWDGNFIKSYDYKAITPVKSMGIKSTSATKNMSSSVPESEVPPIDPTDPTDPNVWVICLTKCHEFCGETIIDSRKCIMIRNPEDPGDGGGGGGGTGGSNNGGGNGGGPSGGLGGGGASGSDYFPPNGLSCNPDPSYTVPIYPAPAGYSWITKCDGPGTVPTPSGPTVSSSKLNSIINFMGITDLDKQNFLLANDDLYQAFENYLIVNGNTQENKAFVNWSAEYLIVNPTDINSFIENNFRSEDFISDNDYESTDLSFDINNNGNVSFVDNNTNFFGFNNQVEPDYPQSHPVSQAIENYSPWIYYAFAGANNTSIKHFHQTAKGLAATDGYSKAIGAIGEGLFVKRLTSVPTFPPADVIIGKYVGTTHIDAYLHRTLPALGNVGFEIAINYTTIDGTPAVTKISHPKGFTFAGQTTTAVAYEIKTYNADKNTVQSLFKAFNEGVRQVKHRANLPGIAAAVLVFDDRAWNKLINSSYGAQVITTMNEITAITNPNGEQIIYLRIEVGLSRDAQKVFYALRDRIKNL